MDELTNDTAGEPTGERTGYLTEQEVAAIQTLHRDAPYSIEGISRGFFSVARHSGGMKYQGFSYVYIPEHDECCLLYTSPSPRD